MRIPCKKVSRGAGKGMALVSPEPISFLGGVNAKTGVVVEDKHPLEGRSLAGKVLVLPCAKGSTVGAYVLYSLKKAGKAPIAMISEEADPILASGAIIAGIPMVHKLKGGISTIRDGAEIMVNADEGYVEVKD